MENEKRILINDRACRAFLKDMHEFGYEDLTLEQVKEIAEQVHQGTHSPTNVIAMWMVREIDRLTK